MLKIITCLLKAPLSLPIELEVAPLFVEIHAESVQGWNAGVRVASIDFADKVAVVFGDEGAGVGGAAEETVMIDNQAVSGGCCS